MRTGTVKWFEPAKGFGFIEDDDGHDRFIHISTVKEAGLETLGKDQRLRFDLGMYRQRPCAVNIRLLEPQIPLQRETRGTVKWYSVIKGYGFISPDNGGKDVQVNSGQVRSAGLPALREFDRLQFVPSTSSGGKISAVQLRKI